MSKRALLYARVSGDDRRKEGRNLAGQLEMCREYAHERGYEIVDELSEDDRGASGYEINLPTLNRVRDMATAGEFDVLVVRELDRLSRNLAKQLVVEEELRRNGVHVEYALAEYPDTPEGNLQKHVKAAIAEYEREKIRERMVRGRRLKVKAGHVLLHSTPPYGYQRATNETTGKDTLAPFEPEARIVRLIFHWYAYGDDGQGPLSIRAIAKKLTEMRVPTRHDTTPDCRGSKKQGHGHWHPGTIGKYLSSETFVGTWHYSKGHNADNPRHEWLPVEVPPLIDTRTWETVQKRRKLNRDTAKRNMKYQYLVRRRLTCGLCGMKMGCHTGTKRTQKGKYIYLYYQCPATHGNTFVRECNLPLFRAKAVDRAVWRWIEGLILDPENLASALRELQAESQRTNQPLHERLGILDEQIADHEGQYQRLLDLYVGGQFPREMLMERKLRLEKTIASLTEERKKLAESLAASAITDEDVARIEEFANTIAQGLANVTFEDQCRVIDLLEFHSTLTVEDGRKVAYAQCVLGKETFRIASTPTQ